MSGWSLDDIAWNRFDAAGVDADLLAVVKTAALVEANAADYVAYLTGVFADDAGFVAAVARWGIEEEQHGAALGRWAELADPGFDFARALADFRAGYRIPQGVAESIRGRGPASSSRGRSSRPAPRRSTRRSATRPPSRC